MKRKIYLLPILFLCFGCSFFNLNQNHDHFQPKLIPEEFHLDNGIKVFYLQDKELPFINFSLTLKGGSLWDESNSFGTVGAMGLLLTQGGAGKRTAEVFEGELIKLSASMSSSFGPEFGSVNFHCLKGDIDQITSMLSDAILRPRFQESRIELLKAQSTEAIYRRIDSPEEVASRSFSQLLYGKDSSFGRASTIESVANISRDKILNAYNKLVIPEGAVIAVSGDIEKGEIKTLLNKKLKDWNSTNFSRNIDLEVPELGITPEMEINRAGLYFIEKPITQSTVVIGQLGVPRRTEDEFPIMAFNQIFGGSIELSRLFDTIRSKKGLAYSIEGGVSPGLLKGQNYIFFQTKNSAVSDAVFYSLKVLEGLKNDLVVDQELEIFKRGQINSFPFEYEAPFMVVSRRATQYLLNIEEGYDQNYIKKINSISKEEIKEVAQNRWDYNKLVVIVVGDRSALTELENLKTRLVQESSMLQMAKNQIIMLKYTDRLVETPRE